MARLVHPGNPVSNDLGQLAFAWSGDMLGPKQMSFSPRQIAAHWVPGFALLVMIFLIDIQNGRTLTNFLEGLHLNTGVAVLVAAAAGFVVGNFLDALRDRVDAVLDRFGWDIKWEFLLEADADKVQREEDYYFTSYVLSANLVIGSLITAIADWWFPNRFSCPVWWLLLTAVVVFGVDAVCLRCCIAKNSHKLWEEAQSAKGS
jgi:hypothetical protein